MVNNNFLLILFNFRFYKMLGLKFKFKSLLRYTHKNLISNFYCNRGNFKRSPIRSTCETIIRLQQNLSIPSCLNISSDLSPFSICSKYGWYIWATRRPHEKHLIGMIMCKKRNHPKKNFRFSSLNQKFYLIYRT